MDDQSNLFLNSLVRSQFRIFGLIKKLKSFGARGLTIILFSLFIANSAFAQAPIEVTLNDEVSAPDQGFILFEFKGNGETSGFQADIVYDDSNMISIDLSDCLTGSDTSIRSCVHPGGDTSKIRVALATTSNSSLGDFTGVLVFEFDGALQHQDVIDFQWDPNSIVTAQPQASVISDDGSITVVREEIFRDRFEQQ